MSGFIVPPGGFAGFSQMTPASRASLFPRGSGGGTRRKRRGKKKRAASGMRKSRSTRRSSRTKRKGPKFGSPAFQKLHKVGKYAKKR